MDVLYATEASNRHLSIVLEKADHWPILQNGINRHSLINDWTVLRFRFEALGNAKLTPEVCTAYLPGMVAFRAELLDVLFPAPCDELEFLPIAVAGQDWLLLNCLKSTADYDSGNSRLLRGTSGQVFMIQRILVNDDSVRRCGVFTISDSNRGQLLLLASVKERIGRSGAQGIEFREVGMLS